MSKKLFTVLLVLLFALVFAVGCETADEDVVEEPPAEEPADEPDEEPDEETDEEPADEPTGEPIVIGHLMAQTGVFGPYGIRTAQGSALAVEEINAAGGILGRPVEIIYEDTEANPSVAVERSRRLVDEAGIQFVMGSASSSVSLALAAEAMADEFIFVNVGGYTPELSAADGGEFVFTTLWNNLQLQRCCALMVSEEPWDRIYNMSPDYLFGHEAWEVFSTSLEEFRADTPFEVVGSDFPAFGTDDFSDYIAKIIAAEPDAIFSTLWATDEIAFLRQGLEFGLFDNVKHYISGAAVPDELALAMGNEGMAPFDELGVTIWAMSIYDPSWPDTDKNKRFIESYYNKFGDYPYAKTWADYAAVYLIKQGIEAAGSTDPSEVSAALSGMSWENEQGTWEIRAQDHMVIPEYIVGGILRPGDFPVWSLDDIRLFPGIDVTPDPMR